MTWKERLFGIPLAIAGAILLAATAAGMALTKTDWGREWVRSYALEKLNSAIAGQIEIDEVLEGDLLRSIRVAGVRVYDPDGQLFARADTVSVSYRWSDFLVGNVTLPRVTLVRPVMTFSIDREGSWNVSEVFSGRDGDSTAAGSTERSDIDSGRRSRSIVLRDVAIRSGEVELRTPWDPDGTDPDSTRWFVESVGDAWERVWRVERLNARLNIARILAPRELGRLFQITQLTGVVKVIGEPFEIEQLRADIEVHGDTLSFDLWQGLLPDSRLFGEGWVAFSGELAYDLAFNGDPATAADLRWLIPRLPSGDARLDLRYRSVADGFSLEVQNSRFSSPDAVLSGRFAMILSDRPNGLSFDAVDLNVQRLRTEVISEVTGWQAPLPGELEGRVAMDGPLSELQVDAEVRIQPDTSGSVSQLRARGTAHLIRGMLGARDLELEADSLDFDVIRAFLPVALRGRLAGSARLDGLLSEGMAVAFELEQRERDLLPLKVNGSGTITADSGVPLRLDVRARSDTISLATLASYYPAIPFRGEFRGDFEVVGSLDDLNVDAHLAGRGDSLRLVGNVQLGQLPRYRGNLYGHRIKLPRLREWMPQSDLDFAIELDGSGTSLGTLEMRGEAEVFASFVGGVRFDFGSVSLRIAEGRVLVDSSVINAEFGNLRASGALSLSREGSDSLRLELQADSLGGLNPWLFSTTELLSDFRFDPEATGIASGEGGRPGIEGSARFDGWLVSERGGLHLRGAIAGERLSYGKMTADSLRVRDLELGSELGRPRVSAGLAALGVGLGGLHFDELELSGGLADGTTRLEFSLAKSGAAAAGRLRIDIGEDVRTISVDDLSLTLGGASWVLAEPALVRLEESGGVAFSRLQLASGSRRAALDGSMGAAGPAAFSAQLDGVDLAEIATLWPDSVVMAGRVKLDAQLSGRVSEPILESSFSVTNGDLFGVSFSNLCGSLNYRRGELAVDASMWQGGESELGEVCPEETSGHRLVHLQGTLPLDFTLPGFTLALPERPIALLLEGDSIPLSLVSVFTDQVAEPRGFARARVEIRGTPGNVIVQGPATLVDGSFRVIRSGITYTQLAGDLLFKGQAVEIREVVFGSPQGGRGHLSGVIVLDSLSNPEFDLRLGAVELAGYDQLDAQLDVSGTARLKGRYGAPDISGDLSVVSGVFFIEEIGRQREIVDPFEEDLILLDTMFAPEERLRRRTGNRFLDNLTIELNVRIQRATWLRSEDTNVEIAGDLSLEMRRARDELKMNGTLRAIRGEYWFFNKRFAVLEGEIEFVGTPATNPNLRIVALYTVRTQKEPIEIRLLVSGTLEDKNLKLESNHQPPIPESDLLSYLLFGRPSYELTRTSAESNLLQDVTAGVPEAFFGYALGSLLLRESGVAYVDITRAPLAPVAEGEYRSGLGPAVTATQVEVGWYLAPTVFVSVAQHLVGVVRPTVKLEWRLDDRLTLRGITEPRFGREGSLYYGGPDSDLEQSIGLFLLYGWAY
ncbi:MAG: translocation/assembly module TamB domain-containing protein [Gemmatimonadota bacterium]|nr:MAG: translocation/assembly module TamB domain-containing protein [Gemmatimonadota bacterium]